MTTRSVAATAAALTTTALLLTACSSGSDVNSDKIAGVPTAPQTATPSTTAALVQRPQITIPKGFSMVFETWDSSDPVKNAVLADGKEAERATNEAILNGGSAESATVAFYSTEGGLTSAKDWIGGFKKNHLTMTGTVAYFNPRVTIRPDGSASLVYCADESKGFSKDLKTGKVDVTPTDSPYQLHNTLLKKNGQGVWQTTAVLTARGKCHR